MIGVALGVTEPTSERGEAEDRAFDEDAVVVVVVVVVRSKGVSEDVVSVDTPNGGMLREAN